MLEPRAEISKCRMKRKDDHEVLNRALGTIENKYEDTGVVDETKLVAT